MKALFWSAVINGVVAVPLMAVIILLASKKSVMGDFTASRPIIVLGWIATAVMGAAAVADVHPRLAADRAACDGRLFVGNDAARRIAE